MTQAPPWEEGRYISLLGDPIGSDGKPVTGFMSWKSPLTQNSVLSEVALGAGLINIFDIYPIVYPVAGLVGARYFKKTARDRLSKKFSYACIDTNPGKDAVRSEDQKALAQMMVEKYNMARIAVAVPTAMAIGLINDQAWFALLTGVSAWMPCILEHRRMFQNVAEGKWMFVEEMPRALPPEEHAPLMSNHPVIGPIPVP